MGENTKTPWVVALGIIEGVDAMPGKIVVVLNRTVPGLAYYPLYLANNTEIEAVTANGVALARYDTVDQLLASNNTDYAVEPGPNYTVLHVVVRHASPVTLEIVLKQQTAYGGEAYTAENTVYALLVLAITAAAIASLAPTIQALRARHLRRHMHYYIYYVERTRSMSGESHER